MAHWLALVAMVASLFPVGTRPAQAFGSKSLTLLHMHTGESATITFSRNGRYDQQALDKLNWLLRDWRNDDAIKMDPRLFDVLYEVYERSGSREPIRVVSSYRSPKTNAMLRRRSKAVAEHSQHMLGKAMDFYLADVAPEKIRAIAMKLQDGGVGYYPRSNTPFIHVDVGSVRSWPRMTRSQLASLFPDGKTVHIPADGTPMPGYDQARAMILARGGRVAGEATYADADDSRFGKRRSLWAALFGGDDDEETGTPQPAQRRTLLASRNAPRQQVASDDESRENGGTIAFVNQQRGNQPDIAPPTRVAIAPPARPDSQAGVAAVAPLPPVRQVATVANTSRGPQMVWQAGPQGQAAAPDPFGAITGTQIALAPQPPRRPEEVMEGDVMTYAPMPPSRPDAAVAAAPATVRDLANAPITTAALAHPVPLPPARLPTRGEKTAAAALSASSAAPTNRTEGTPGGTMATASHRTQPHSQRIGGNWRGFSQTAYADLSTSRFTGPAVKTTIQH